MKLQIDICLVNQMQQLDRSSERFSKTQLEIYKNKNSIRNVFDSVQNDKYKVL